MRSLQGEYGARHTSQVQGSNPSVRGLTPGPRINRLLHCLRALLADSPFAVPWSVGGCTGGPLIEEQRAPLPGKAKRQGHKYQSWACCHVSKHDSQHLSRAERSAGPKALLGIFIQKAFPKHCLLLPRIMGKMAGWCRVLLLGCKQM